jgi:Fe-S-cluster containining protein
MDHVQISFFFVLFLNHFLEDFFNNCKGINSMHDGFIRKSIKYVARIRYTTDLKLTRWLKSSGRKNLYRLAGSCLQCGKCCETPMIRIFPLFFYLKSLRWAINTWQRMANGFEFVDENRRDKCLIFRCTHLDPTTKHCDAYQSRPGICRDYPLNQLDAPVPVFLEGCGYRAVLRNAEKFDAALDTLDLPAETLQKLKHDLQLEGKKAGRLESGKAGKL